MSGNSGCSIYIGNLDERVSDRVLYDILIQAGRVVDLYIPRDKETDKPKGFAFAEYETEDVADYAVRLFSGLVTLYNRTLKFAISGQDKSSQNLPNAAVPASNSAYKSRHYPGVLNHMEISQQPKRLSTPSRVPDYPARYSQDGRTRINILLLNLLSSSNSSSNSSSSWFLLFKHPKQVLSTSSRELIPG